MKINLIQLPVLLLASKFGLARPYNNHAREAAMEKPSPISFNLSENKPALKTFTSFNIKGEIKKLPGGIQISFTGSTQNEVAIKLLVKYAPPMFWLNDTMHYLLCLGKTDIRKGMNTLFGVVQNHMGYDD